MKVYQDVFVVFTKSKITPNLVDVFVSPGGFAQRDKRLAVKKLFMELSLEAEYVR